MISASIDTRGLLTAVREFGEATGQNMREALRYQAAALVASCMSITPPGTKLKEDASTKPDAKPSQVGARTLSNADKKSQETNVEIGIRSIFATTNAKDERVRQWVTDAFFPPKVKAGKVAQFPTPSAVAFTQAEIYRFHQANRNQRGRTSMRRGTAWTRKGLLSAYVKQAKKNVGYLASGWAPSAAGVKLSKRYTPAWVGRHRGGYAPKIVDIGLYLSEITVGNNHDIAPNIQRKIQFAVYYRIRMASVQAAAIVKRNEERANRRLS